MSLPDKPGSVTSSRGDCRGRIKHQKEAPETRNSLVIKLLHCELTTPRKAYRRLFNSSLSFQIWFKQGSLRENVPAMQKVREGNTVKRPQTCRILDKKRQWWIQTTKARPPGASKGDWAEYTWVISYFWYHITKKKIFFALLLDQLVLSTSHCYCDEGTTVLSGLKSYIVLQQKQWQPMPWEKTEQLTVKMPCTVYLYSVIFCHVMKTVLLLKLPIWGSIGQEHLPYAFVHPNRHLDQNDIHMFISVLSFSLSSPLWTLYWWPAEGTFSCGFVKKYLFHALFKRDQTDSIQAILVQMEKLTRGQGQGV